MNRGRLRTRILETLNEDASAPAFYSEDEINALIDEAAEVMCEETQAIKRTYFLPLRQGCGYYSLSSLSPLAMAPWRLYLQSQDRRLGACSMSELDARHITWSTVTGDPWHWFPVSWDLFGLWPRPSEGGGVLRVDALCWPRSLDDDSDEPEFLGSDHDALVLYGVTEGAAKRWDAATAVTTWSLFMNALGKASHRSSLGRVQSRSFQVGMAGDVGFSTGVITS